MGRKLPGWLGIGWNVLPDAYDKIGYLGSNLLTPVPNPFNDFVGPGNGRSGAKIPLGKLYEIMPLWDQITTYGDPDGVSNYNAMVRPDRASLCARLRFPGQLHVGKGDDGRRPDTTGGSIGYVQAGLPYGKDDYVNIRYPLQQVCVQLQLRVAVRQGQDISDRPADFRQQSARQSRGRVDDRRDNDRSPAELASALTNDCPDWYTAGQATNSDEACRPAFVSSAGIKSDWSNHASGHRALIGAANYQPWLNFAAFRTPQFYPNPTGAAGVYAEIGNVPANS